MFVFIFSRQPLRTLMTSSLIQPGRNTLQNGSCHQGILESVKLDNLWSYNSVRTNVRCHFPYPRETKRVRVHGFKKRMSTRSGRAILMRRILKGRHVLSH